MFKYIICDLDGTILNDADRHYRCYCDIVAKYGGNCIDPERYWDMKRKKIKRTVLLEETGFQGTYQEFLDEWISRIETMEYLNQEKLKPLAKETLQLLKSNTEHLYLATMRQNRDNLLKQLENLGIKDYFDVIYSTSPLKERTKAELLQGIVDLQQTAGSDNTSNNTNSNINSDASSDASNDASDDKTKKLVLGDSEADEALAREIGATYIAMTDGIREQQYLKGDVYCNGLKEVQDWIMGRG